MTAAILGSDPLETLVDAALRRLSEGVPPSAMEVERVDVKEQPDRRGPGSSIRPGAKTNDQAADYLAGEMACMADTLVVTSPGGFVGDVTPGNIITHVAVPRYKSLALTLARLGLAEREGVGVDRMVGDMLRAGRPAPVFSEVEGPFVRVALLGGPADQAIVDLLADLMPPRAGTVEALLLIDHLARCGWVDAQTAAPVLQRPAEEAEQAIGQLAETALARHDADQAASDPSSVIVKVKGVPAAQSAAYRLSDDARERLAHRVEHLTTPEGRVGLILDWSQGRGRVSSTEAADLTGLSRASTARLLTRLAEEGQLDDGRPNRTGRGFFYTPAAIGPNSADNP